MTLRSLFALTACLCLPLFAQEPPKPAPTPDAKEQAPKTLQLGQRVAGEITLLDLDGKPLKAHDQMGKLTVVNFYSIQCPIQRAWDQRLAAIQKDFAGQGVTFLHINSNATEIGTEPPKPEGDAKPYANVRDHLAKSELPFRVLVDHGNKVADLFDAKTTPHVYVFGKDGKLVYKGLVDDDQKDKNAEKRQNHLRDVLGKLLKGETVEPFATKEQGCTIKRAGAAGGRARGEGRRRGEGGGD